MAIARATIVDFVCFGRSSAEEKLLSMHNKGGRGMVQPKIVESFWVTLTNRAVKGDIAKK